MGHPGQQARAMEPSGWQALDQVEKKWQGLVLVDDAVVDEGLVERVSKAARCLERWSQWTGIGCAVGCGAC